MSEIAVIGEHPTVVGFALAGALVCPAQDPAQVRAAWSALPPSVAVVVLTPVAAEALADLRASGTGPLTVVMPL